MDIVRKIIKPMQACYLCSNLKKLLTCDSFIYCFDLFEQEIRVIAKPRKTRHKPRPVPVTKTPSTLARWTSVQSVLGMGIFPKPLGTTASAKNLQIAVLGASEETPASAEKGSVITADTDGHTAAAENGGADIVQKW